MASTSPSPNSPATLEPPPSSNSPRPQPSSPPPNPLNSPSPENASKSQSNSTASTPSPLIASPPPSPSSPPPMASTPASPPVPTLSPPPPVSLPPPSSSPPPPRLADPPARQPPLPPPSLSDPPPRSPPPPISNPPVTSPPPPPAPPSRSPPPPSTEPPLNSPPPPPTRPTSSPPPLVAEQPQNAPPPPTAKPQQNSPPPPKPPNPPPESSPPPPTSDPPENSPPPPRAKPPKNTPPPPASIPPESPSPPNVTPPLPSLNSPPRSPPPPPAGPPPRPINQIPPPPSSLVSSPPSPALVPSATSNTNATIANVPPNSQPRGGGGISTGGTVAIGLVLAFLLLSITGTAAWCIWKRKKKASELSGVYVMPNSLGSSPKSDAALLKMQISSPNNGSDLGHSRSWFTYEELVVATNGFSPQNLLGEGGFGSVYKGTLADGKEVAVKLLKVGGQQGEREFRSEVEIISRIHHRHLVSLVGYCISDTRRLLVFDYVANDTLYFHLHGESRPVMDWPTRVKIAIGAARGIAYLHEDCHPRIIHRDIKSSNILLDNNFEARVSDFGLAKLAIDTNTHITTRVMGTFGYMAPEYASSGKLTEKSDVFSFGVVLLELITGRKPVDMSQPLGDESLVEWARPLLSHALETEEFEELADPRLERNYVDSEMFRLIEVAAACIRHSSAKRPKMGQVARALDSMAASDLTNGMRLGESEIFNSAQQSEEIRLFRRMAFGSQNYSTDFFNQSSWSSSSEPSKY